MSDLVPTARTTVRRLSQRGHYDRATVYRILDEGFVCHVGFAVDGQPYVIPTGSSHRDMRGLTRGRGSGRTEGLSPPPQAAGHWPCSRASSPTATAARAYIAG
jgi:hypothetical protein